VPRGAHLILVPRRRAVAASVAATVLAGCSSTLEVPSPAPTGPATTVCDELLDAAPDTVAGAARREVDSDGAALAWGSPPVVLRCGVTAAVGLGPTSRCDMIDGVGWYSEDLDTAYRFTTIGREVPIEVTVPHEYAPEAAVLIDLADAVKTSDPVRQRCV
jgi:hypothetical protein